jgi:uncharacterized protein
MEKLYFSYEDIHKIVKKIALMIQKDNWKPDCIVGIAGGGFVPSRILRNYIKKDIYIVGLKRYTEENVTYEIPIKVQWIDEEEKKITGQKILLVDEIDDTRVTLSYCISELLKYKPKEIRTAVIHQKIKTKLAELPEKAKIIYQGQEVPDKWIVYPWDANDIEKHNELCEKYNI